jgi:hypothetical protein
MKPERTCPDCGATLPADAPRGLCPNCLMGAALSRTSVPGPAVTGTFGPAGPAVLDTIAQSIGPVSRVLLQDTAPGETPGPIIRPDATVQEVFAMTVLPGRRYPELINDDNTLLENSFVVPDVAMADEPASLRGHAEPTRGAAGSAGNGSVPRLVREGVGEVFHNGRSLKTPGARQR